MTPTSSEQRISRVTLLLAADFGVLPTSVEEGPAGTATCNYVATSESGDQWFLKTYRSGTDLRQAEQAAELSEYAGTCGVPVARALRTVRGNRLVAHHQELALSVTRFVPDAETAEGRLSGRRWDDAGQAVGRLHRGLARHEFGPPRHGPWDKAIDLSRNAMRLERLVSRYETVAPRTEFERWALATAREKLARLPEVRRLLEPLPRTMLSQLVHGDLSGPNVLLKGERVASLVDFYPPVRRSPVWEVGRLALDPRTVLAQPDWPEGLGRLAVVYHRLHPTVSAVELVSVVRMSAAALALSVYPLNVVVDELGPLTPSLEAYGRARQQAAEVLRDRLDEAEEILRDHLE